jgi:hypothetical protein
VGVALGAARRHFHAFVQRADSAAPGGQHPCFGGGTVQALCWTGEPEVCFDAIDVALFFQTYIFILFASGAGTRAYDSLPR